MFFTLLYKCFSLSALFCEEKGCFYAKLFVMTLWSGLISRRGLDSHWRNIKFTSLGNQDSLIIMFLEKKRKKEKKSVSVHNNFCISFLLLCVKLQLLRKDPTREKQNVFSHFSWKPMSWLIMLLNLPLLLCSVLFNFSRLCRGQVSRRESLWLYLHSQGGQHNRRISATWNSGC